MTDVDENLLTLAKLREQVRGDLDGDDRLHAHVALVDDEHNQALNFAEHAVAGASGIEADSLENTDLGRVLYSNAVSSAASDAVRNVKPGLASYIVGITEQELDASSLTLPLRLADELERDDVLTTILAAGNPNTGKTNTMAVCAELSKQIWDDLLVISNVRSWDLTDKVATSAHELAVTLLEHRDVPKFVLVDEGSTHFDNRSYAYEVANQWSPLQKRMSKVGVQVLGVIGHTGKDVDPEAKRLTNLAFWKEEKDSAEFFSKWPAEDDRPDDRLFGGSLEALEATATSYDPDDAAPWEWNLEAGLFSNDLDWDDLLDELKRRGPASD